MNEVALSRVIEHRRKLPPYEVLKGLFLGGMTYTQLAERYGCSKRAVEMTLRTRALNRGEWPLLTTEQRERRRHLELVSRADNVKVHVIRELLRCFLRNKGMTTAEFAARFDFHPLFVRDIRSPRGHETITVANAVRVLDAIGEPVPSWMREPWGSTA